MIFSSRSNLAHAILLFFCLLFLLPAAAEEAASAAEPPPAKRVSEGLRSPRATMATFLHAMNDIKRGAPDRIDSAVTTLDLSDVNSLVLAERSKDLAWMLLEVLDKTRVIDLALLPDEEQGEPYLFQTYQNGAVRIARLDDGRWLFTRDTIASLPSLLDEVQDAIRVKGTAKDEKFLPWHIRLRQWMPDGFKRDTLLLANWQWIALFLIVLFGLVVDKLLSRLLQFFIQRWKTRTSNIRYRNISDGMLRPFGLMAMAVVWWLGINLLALPEEALLVLLVAVKFLASLSGVWVAYRLVDLVSIYLLQLAKQTESRLDDALMPLVPRTLKIFVTIIGFVFIADNLNMDVSSLLAGVGLGGLAFALAAKDMVQNLFGSLTVLMDRTFSVGDWVVVGDVEGSVESIGFRSTRVRTFYNSVVTVPNSKFITADVDNMGERMFRRLSCKLSLTYDTPPDRIEAFCEGVRELVRQHPYMRKDYYQVYLNEFAGSSLDVLLYVFWATPEWSTELRERHRFLLDILRLAKRLKVEFAYPTQTLYMRSEQLDSGMSADAGELSVEQALNLGRQQASEVVNEHLKSGEIPPPVTFPRV